MSLQERIQHTLTLRPCEKHIMGLLADEPLTSRQIVDYVMSDPYNLSFQEVSDGLCNLHKKGLLAIKGLVPNRGAIDVEIKLTFASDWIFKL